VCALQYWHVTKVAIGHRMRASHPFILKASGARVRGVEESDYTQCSEHLDIWVLLRSLHVYYIDRSGGMCRLDRVLTVELLCTLGESRYWLIKSRPYI
jgi:hypothetical protein